MAKNDKTSKTARVMNLLSKKTDPVAEPAQEPAPAPAASINIVAKRPDQFSKGIILAGIVEFYAILSLVATILLVMMYQL